MLYLKPWPRKNLSGEVAKLQPVGGPSMTTAPVSSGGDGGDKGNGKGKGKKIVPMSRQLSAKIQGCSQRLAEIMSWNAKLDASTLKLICTIRLENSFDEVDLIFRIKHYLDILTRSLFIQPRTEQLVNGFKNELSNRSAALSEARVELENCYGVRVDDDDLMNKEEHSEHKTRCMRAVRNCETVWTSLAGSLKSVKSVVESRLYDICS